MGRYIIARPAPNRARADSSCRRYRTPLSEFGQAVTEAAPAATIGENPELRSPVAVLAPRQAKGLEFDMVLLAEPAQIVAGSPRGRADLYVALTRATQCLGVLHSSPVPAAVSRAVRR
jgi:DNA helicase IV